MAVSTTDDIFRDRDVIIFDKGKTFTVNLSQTMVAAGWKGGQGVQYTIPQYDEPYMTFSNGVACGFLLWGSNEAADQYTAMTENQPTYAFATMGAGSWLISTATYEMYTYESRTGPGPLVPLVYNASDRLLFSLRGLWTNEDEWTLSGDPRAPNTFYVGSVAQIALPAWNNYLTIQTSL
jgi:hypothetical protein